MPQSSPKITAATLAEYLVALTLDRGAATREALLDRGFAPADLDRLIEPARVLARKEMVRRGLVGVAGLAA